MTSVISHKDDSRTEIRTSVKSALARLTFLTYEAASQRSLTTLSPPTTNDPDFPLNSATNLGPVIRCGLRLSGLLLSPYVLVPVVPVIFLSGNLPVAALITFVMCLINVAVYNIATPPSPVTHKEGYNAVGATTPPGLYYATASPQVKSIIAKCPLLASDAAQHGSLPDLPATPWIVSGDMRTLFPFLSYAPTPVVYVRRWVRVPVADGPLDNMVHVESTHCTKGGGEGRYEAVALDCACAADAPPPQQSSSPPPPGYALLILAGLTGGSGEGYVVDLVNSARARGVDCYVMLGRGLGGTLNLSEAAFHGARTSDLRESARVLRNALPQSTQIFVVGISMGGIIVTNAAARGVLTGLVDGAVSVSGCFDTSKNIHFSHSRSIWQPLLTFGLKQSFVAPKGALTKMERRMGATAAATVERAVDVIDFDSTVVTALHRFHDVYHYYGDMSGASDEHLLAMVSRDRRATEGGGDVGAPLVDLDEVMRDNNQQDNGWVDVAQATAAATATTAAAATATATTAATAAATATADATAATAAATAATAAITATATAKDPAAVCGLPIPLLAINAADDPIIHVDTAPCRSGAAAAVENLICLVTRTGGHVGWPLGLAPWRHLFKFQNSLIFEFCEAVVGKKKID